MFIIELILIIAYVMGGGGTLLRANFHRELAKARGAAEPTTIDEAVHHKLSEVKKTFEGLFRDERAKENALSLFPDLKNLGPEPEGKKPEIPGIGRMLIDSTFWPIMLPFNFSVNAAHNIVNNETKDKLAKSEQLQMLAEYEEDPELKAAYLTGDETEIGRVVHRKAVASNAAARLAEEAAERLQIEAAKVDPNDMLNLANPSFTFDYDEVAGKVSNVAQKK